MTTLTLRLPPSLDKRLERACKKMGLKKTDIVVTLIQNYLQQEKQKKSLNSADGVTSLSKIVGIVSLGGDAVEDSDAPFE